MSILIKAMKQIITVSRTRNIGAKIAPPHKMKTGRNFFPGNKVSFLSEASFFMVYHAAAEKQLLQAQSKDTAICSTLHSCTAKNKASTSEFPVTE